MGEEEINEGTLEINFQDLKQDEDLGLKVQHDGTRKCKN